MTWLAKTVLSGQGGVVLRGCLGLANESSGGSVIKNLPIYPGDMDSILEVGKIPWRRK